jgi:hypothetical protein
MSEVKAGSSKPIDPLEMFRGMRDTYLDSMAKAMVETVNSEAYAQATGAMLNQSLALTAPLREAMEKSMLQALQQLSLPSRQDIVALADRFTNLEMRLDDMGAQLDRIEKRTYATVPVTPTEPTSSTSAINPVTHAAGEEPLTEEGSERAVMQGAAEEPAAPGATEEIKQAPPRKRAARKATR